MRHTAFAILAMAVVGSAQSSSGPTFDIVSIKKHVREPGPEQLGLKLDAARAELDALIIDRLERPTEN